jgi:CheY-like chemotaxis protein
LYSIEAICDALITAGSAAAYCRNEEEFLRCALQSAGDLLDVSCSTFYGASTSPLEHIGNVRVNQRAGGELDIPATLPSSLTDYLRQQPNQIIVSAEWDALETLLPAFDFNSSSSLWLVVGDDEKTFGTLAFFDHAARRFDRTQQKISRLVSMVMTLGLQVHGSRHASRPVEAASYHEFSKLVGGVARDLINPLTAIFGYVELLKAEAITGRSPHLLARMEEQIEKARKVVSSFSTQFEWPKQREGEPIAAIPRTEVERPLAPAVAKIGPTAGARILLVQPSDAVLEFQRSVLMALGVQVFPASSGNEAIDLLRAQELDAIILDDELEDACTSKKLVWWVRENRPNLAERMLITVSRKPSAETREILEIAMLPHVTKPLEVLELYSRAQQVLQNGRGQQLVQ